MSSWKRGDERRGLSVFLKTRSASFWTTVAVVVFAFAMAYGAPPPEGTVEGNTLAFAIALSILFGLPCYGIGRLVRYLTRTARTREIRPGVLSRAHANDW